MPFRIPQITTVILLFHLGSGCCWHHTHTCSVDFCESPAAATARCECDGQPAVVTKCGEHGEKTPRHNDGAPHRHSCDGERCSFVRSESSASEIAKFWLAPCTISSLLTLSVTDALPTRHAVELDRAVREDPPRLRPHLRFSVLLI